MTTSSVNRAYSEGVRAFGNREGLRGNPYPENDMRHEYWDRGYRSMRGGVIHDLFHH